MPLGENMFTREISGVSKPCDSLKVKFIKVNFTYDTSFDLYFCVQTQIAFVSYCTLGRAAQNVVNGKLSIARHSQYFRHETTIKINMFRRKHV